jgi:hypothetical protein
MTPVSLGPVRSGGRLIILSEMAGFTFVATGGAEPRPGIASGVPIRCRPRPGVLAIRAGPMSPVRLSVLGHGPVRSDDGLVMLATTVGAASAPRSGFTRLMRLGRFLAAAPRPIGLATRDRVLEVVQQAPDFLDRDGRLLQQDLPLERETRGLVYDLP